MLALLFGVLISGFYVLCLAIEIRGLVTGRTSLTGWLAADVTFTTILVEIAARASWTVFVQNRHLPK